MANEHTVANDVYERFGLKWADFPALITPSAHSDEVELFCAKQSMAVYAAYPNLPHSPAYDHIPSRLREAIIERGFSAGRMIEGGGDVPSRDFESEQGYRIVVTDRAGALLVWKQDHLVIAFRGTANWQDWIHNFAGAPITTGLVAVSDELHLHKGFTGLAENIAPAVMELIAEFLKMRGSQNRPATLTLCGHSLGGALALNFAARFRHSAGGGRWFDFNSPSRNSIRLGATYTFGAPCIGKGQVWNFISRPHYRLIVRGDPVPSIPPLFTSDFEATYLDQPTKAPVQPKGNLGKIKKAIGTIITRATGFDPTLHDVEVYIEAIERKIAVKSSG